MPPAQKPSLPSGLFSVIVVGAGLAALTGVSSARPTETAAANYRQKVEPLLSKYCYDCHGNGVGKGKVAFDEFKSDADVLAHRDLWFAALKNLRAGLMPPREEGLQPPSAEEINTLANWIKYEAFGTNPANPDPGQVTVRRLNRIEYRNTIRDLMGYDFNAEVEFPPDDSGNGFDNNGDVLTVSPLLLEKYLAAAEVIVDKAVPKVAKILRERTASGRDFRATEGGGNGEQMSAKRALKVSRSFNAEQSDKYKVSIELEVRGSFDFDPARCKLICRIDDQERFTEEVAWAERRTIKHEYEIEWPAGNHVISFEVVPLPPSGSAAAAAPWPAEGTATTGTPPANAAGAPRGDRIRPPTSTNVTIRVASVQVKGPLDPKFWTTPENYARFFPRSAAPAEPAARDAYAAEVLRAFATRAYRRPVDDGKVRQLVGLAKQFYSLPGRSFEDGVGRAMMAVLGSPRFLFRIEEIEPKFAADPIAPIDEFSLASRLSYFLWSTMPDEELFGLAQRGELRRELRGQVARMLKDPKAQAFVRNFTGQWLQARDVEFVPLNARAVFGSSVPNVLRNRDGRPEFGGDFRKLLRSETEMYFDYVLREDRSVLELVDSDYTFLNERLAAFYGVPDVTGDQLRRVQLPADSPRGGVLTQGTTLVVTSNPTRTSPVKRGLFILENILGTPPPPAPPNVPDLEESKKEFKDREPKLSEMLAVHRTNKLCYSCHQRMDPLGLAMENFNALGFWRDQDASQPIDAAGELITGEKFADVRELKRVLVRDRKLDVYRCLTEKLMTYALGRGIEYHDVHTVDAIVDQLARENGRMMVLMNAIIESPAFQKQRTSVAENLSPKPAPRVSVTEPRP